MIGYNSVVTKYSAELAHQDMYFMYSMTVIILYEYNQEMKYFAVA